MQCEMQKGGVYGTLLMRQTAKKMWQQGGVRAYFRGLLWGLIGQYPYSAIDLSMFEYTKRWYIRRREDQGFQGKDTHPNAPVTAIIGGLSGAVGASLVWPINLLRTRLQTGGTVLQPQQYTGMMDVTQKTLSTEGVRGLFKGILPNLIKVVPAVAVTYTVYEQAKQAFGLP